MTELTYVIDDRGGRMHFAGVIKRYPDGSNREHNAAETLLEETSAAFDRMFGDGSVSIIKGDPTRAVDHLRWLRGEITRKPDHLP